MKKHNESDLQIQCVRWFRYQYPEFARLLEHPHNEGNAFTRQQQIIANREGVTKGVADLILHIPAYIYDSPSISHSDCYHSLAIEMKTETGKQGTEQQEWQLLFVAAGGKYEIVRSFDQFQQLVKRWMLNVPIDITEAVKYAHHEIEERAKQEALKRFNEIIHPKK